MIYNQRKQTLKSRCISLTNIIRFRTREEWEQEKKEKMLAEWDAYLAFEEEALRKAAEEKAAKIQNEDELDHTY